MEKAPRGGAPSRADSRQAKAPWLGVKEMQVDTAVEQHDWVAYWDSFLARSAERQASFRRLDAPQCLLTEEARLAARWTELRQQAEAGTWHPHQGSLPYAYRLRPDCACCVCTHLRSLGQTPESVEKERLAAQAAFEVDLEALREQIIFDDLFGADDDLFGDDLLGDE